MWRYTLHYARVKSREGDETAKRMLREAGLEENQNTDKTKLKPGPKDEFFRNYSFITVAAKNKTGCFIFRNALYRIAEKRTVSEMYDRKVIRLTIKVAKALGLENTDTCYHVI